MPDPVKPARRYDSPRRREQAEATRGLILDAAQLLFERDGYAATTMAAVAAEAGVALKTVYVAFETKAGMLRALWNARLREGNDGRPMAEHPMVREVLTEPDPARQLRLNARNSRLGKLRIAALAEVIRTAAPIDPEIGQLWQLINSDYHDNQRAVISSLQAKRALRPGLDVRAATDILWAINHPGTWQLLVVLRGWSPERYERWSAEAACQQLLTAGSPAPATPAG
jgi:AcrR family transcriptional regulator